MKRFIVIAAAAVTLSLAAPLLAWTAKPKPAPTLKCAVTSVAIVGKQVIAAGDCKIGAKSAPAKWAWTTKSADLSGSPCRFGTATGHGRKFNLPLVPAGIQGSGNPLIPGQYAAVFTVTASWGKQTAKATRTLKVRTVDSKVLCGAPPKLISLDGPTPSPLTWATPPTFDGTILRAGTIQSRGNGQCKWHSFGPIRESVLVIGWTFSCPDSHYTGLVSFSAYYSTDGGNTYCGIGVSRTSSFVVQPAWGSGLIDLQAKVETYVPGAEPPVSWEIGNFWESGWIPLHGNTAPCTREGS